MKRSTIILDLKVVAELHSVCLRTHFPGWSEVTLKMGWVLNSPPLPRPSKIDLLRKTQLPTETTGGTIQ